jgi:hypothetical protein
MTPIMFVAFRIFTLTLGRLSGLGRWLKARLVKTLIYRRKSVPVRFKRRIEFGERRVSVYDALAGPGGADMTELRRESVFTTIHMGSSRYFIANELTDMRPADAIDPRAVVAGVTLARDITVD